MKKFLLIIIGILLIADVFALVAEQNVTVTIISGETKIYSPINETVYNSKIIPINLSADSQADYLKYIDNGDEIIILCKNCNEYGFSKLRRKSFDEGFHNLIIATVIEGKTFYEYTTFIVDTKNPKITKTSPQRVFSNGSFEVEFQEENPISLWLNYGNNQTGLKNQEVDLNKCKEEKTGKKCSVNVSLNNYDLQEIEYWFNITDILGNYDNSRIRKLNVDISTPIINSFNYTINKNKVTFSLNITEPNFEEVVYIDNNKTKQRWKTLCIKLKNKICKQYSTFTIGNHNLTINILDEAGNIAEIKNIEFTIV